jgi:protein-L-isoaspartate O-methyltransferase
LADVYEVVGRALGVEHFSTKEAADILVKEGFLVMPVGPAYTSQHLTVVEKIAPGETTTRAVTLVRFVPFTRSQN